MYKPEIPAPITLTVPLNALLPLSSLVVHEEIRPGAMIPAGSAYANLRIISRLFKKCYFIISIKITKGFLKKCLNSIFGRILS